MCSAWASSSPSAVNSAAEQSARSLMLGLNAARRSTAPISSATPVEPRDQDLQRRRIEAHGRASHRAGEHERAGRARLGPPAVGHPDRAVGLGDHRGPTAGGRTDRRAGRPMAHGRRHPGRGPQATTSTGRVRAGVAVAALVLAGKASTTGHRAARGSGPVAAVEASGPPPCHRRRRPVRRPRRRHRCRNRPRRAPGARPDAQPARHAGGRRRGRAVGHDSTRSTCAGRGQDPDRREHAGPGRHDHRGHAQRLGQRAGVQRPGAAERHQGQPAGIDAPLDRHRPQRLLHRRVDHRDHALGGRPRPRSSAAARPRRRRAARGRGSSASAGMRPATRSASVTVGSVPPAAVAGRPGHGAGAASGPTTSAPPASIAAIEPPPAPMVCTSSDGSRTGSPADLPLGRRLRLAVRAPGTRRCWCRPCRR